MLQSPAIAFHWRTYAAVARRRERNRSSSSGSCRPRHERVHPQVQRVKVAATAIKRGLDHGALRRQRSCHGIQHLEPGTVPLLIVDLVQKLLPRRLLVEAKQTCRWVRSRFWSGNLLWSTAEASAPACACCTPRCLCHSARSFGSPPSAPRPLCSMDDHALLDHLRCALWCVLDDTSQGPAGMNLHDSR